MSMHNEPYFNIKNVNNHKELALSMSPFLYELFSSFHNASLKSIFEKHVHRGTKDKTANLEYEITVNVL
jgi:hypothetical protein